MKISIDDGCASDMRIADLCERYEIPVTFYWPIEMTSLALDNGYRALDYVQAMKIANKHEIGSHTITHRHLTRISIDEAIKEIVGSQFMLQRMYGQHITKFCPPRGYTDDILTVLILKYYNSIRLTKGPNLVHIHPDSGANGNVDWRDYYKAIEKTDDLELWGHSWEIDKYNLWDQLEGVLRETSHS